MIDPDTPLDSRRLDAVRQAAIKRRGAFSEPFVIERRVNCIVDKVRRGVVGDGILYRDLVGDSGAPSWVGHVGLLASVLALVSIKSYETDALLLGALTRATKPPPTDGFCHLFCELGLVASEKHREECLEMWDHHWKHAISPLESRDVRAAARPSLTVSKCSAGDGEPRARC